MPHPLTRAACARTHARPITSPVREPEWDLLIIGGGAAGLAAARSGAARNARTLLVSAGPLGGDCTFTGCVPSKALISAAARGDDFSSARQAIDRSIALIAATEDDAVMAREGVVVRHAHARLVGRGVVDLDGVRTSARRIVLATGSRPVIPPISGLERIDVLTNENVFAIGRLPATLAVIGGGAIGCELSQAFARLGSHVTIVEALDRVLAREEPEASHVINDALASDGVDLRLGVQVRAVERRAPSSVRLELADGAHIDVEHVLVATGRAPMTGDLGLVSAGVEVDERGHVRIDDRLATTAAGIFAAGDVTGVLPFTHVADEMGRIAADNALSRRRHRRLGIDAIPWVTFTDPEVARVGLSEEQAAQRRGSRVAYLPMTEVDRAIVSGETRGFVKLVGGRRRLVGDLGGGRLLGATVVASRGGELIHEAALAIKTGMFAGRLAQTVHAYPTWSVAMRVAAAQLVMEVGGRRARPAQATEMAA